MSEETRAVVDEFFKTFSGADSSDNDLNDFRKRISSYIVEQKWVRRPLILSPSICSQYGWKCLNSNLLECVSCSAKLCVRDVNIEMLDAFKACIVKVLKDLKDSHKPTCPWPLAPSPESFVKMFAMPKEESLKYFLYRLKSSLELRSAIPQIKETVSLELGLEQQHISSLCQLAEMKAEDTDLLGMSLVTMAATGWALKADEKNKGKIHISCENCQRFIASGSFNTVIHSNNVEDRDKENGINGDGTPLLIDIPKAEDSPALKKKRFKKDDFHPLEEHRLWCLWTTQDQSPSTLNSKVEHPSADKEVQPICFPGWRIFLNSLLRNCSETQDSNSVNSPSKEQLRSVRSLLESWT